MRPRWCVLEVLIESVSVAGTHRGILTMGQSLANLVSSEETGVWDKWLIGSRGERWLSRKHLEFESQKYWVNQISTLGVWAWTNPSTSGVWESEVLGYISTPGVWAWTSHSTSGVLLFLAVVVYVYKSSIRTSAGREITARLSAWAT